MLCLIVTAALLAGCAAATDRTQRASTDWSRGVRVGKTYINSRVGIATDVSSGSTMLVWMALEDAQHVLRFARVDGSGKVVAEGILDVPAGIPSQLELMLDGQGIAHLVWMARVDRTYQLWHVTFDAQGALLSQPAPLSPPDTQVVGFALSTADSGESDLLWVADQAPGFVLYHTHIDASGQRLDADVRLREAVSEANVRRDRNGQLHVAWMDEPAADELAVYYATFDAQRRALTEPTRLADVPGATGLVQRGPEIGLGGDLVYLLWSVERRGGGLTQSSSETYYVAFPLGQPALAGKPVQVLIPTDNRPEGAPQAVLGHTRQLALPGTRPLGGRTTYLPATPYAHLDALATPLAVNLVGRTRDTVQIVMLFWDEGAPLGYQIAGKTTGSSLWSSVAVDGAQNVHLAWIDTAGFGSYDIYYASTAPEVRAHLNRVRLVDVLGAVFSVVWALAGSLALFPVAFMWFAIPLGIVSVYLVISAEGGMERRASQIMLGVGILVYVLLKYATESSWLTLLQLPGLPAWLSSVLVLLAPLLIAALAGLVSWVLLRRREYQSLFRVFVVWAALDALITLLLYVPILLIE